MILRTTNFIIQSCKYDASSGHFCYAGTVSWREGMPSPLTIDTSSEAYSFPDFCAECVGRCPAGRAAPGSAFARSAGADRCAPCTSLIWLDPSSVAFRFRFALHGNTSSERGEALGAMECDG